MEQHPRKVSESIQVLAKEAFKIHLFLFIFLTANEEENSCFARLLLVAQVPI